MNSTLIRSAAAALLMVAAAPAFAADKGGASAPQPADTAPAKYCLSPSQLPPPFETGTLLKSQPKRECLTRKQWSDKGVTFDVK